MDFQELLEFCKSKAIKNALLPTEDSVWRTICRTYSKKFHTPLQEVFELNPEMVVLNVLEEQMSDTEPLEKVEEWLDQIYTLQDPSYKQQKEEDMEQFIKGAQESEAKRLRRTKKTLLKNGNVPEENKPTGGSVDFSGLKNEG